MEKESSDQFTVLMLGDAGVGKSAIVQSFHKNDDTLYK